MTTAGVKGILITVADGKAENPAIAKARKKGVIVIALDSPTVPPSATERPLRDEQLQRGSADRQIRPRSDEGQEGDDRDARRACRVVGGSSATQRLPEGFGIKGSNSQIACVGNGEGQTAPSQTAMENCLQKNPNINVVYTINEPSAAGAWTALKNAGKTQAATTIVSVDGGCAGVRNVRAGVIDATSQQYPLLMASRGVGAVVKYAKTGIKPNGLHGHRREPDREEGARRRPIEDRQVRPRKLLGLESRSLNTHRDRRAATRSPVAAGFGLLGSGLPGRRR